MCELCAKYMYCMQNTCVVCKINVLCAKYMCCVQNTCVMCKIHVSYAKYMCHVQNTCIVCKIHVSCAKYMCHVQNPCVMCKINVLCAKYMCCVQNTCAVCKIYVCCVQKQHKLSQISCKDNKYIKQTRSYAVADPEFTRGVRNNSKRGCEQLLFWPIYSQKLHEIERIWIR